MEVTTIAIDLAKNVFALCGADADGQIVVRKELRRAQLSIFMCKLGPGVIGMETAGVLQRFTEAYGERFSVQRTGPRQFCAVLASVEINSGRALDVKRINLRGLA